MCVFLFFVFFCFVFCHIVYLRLLISQMRFKLGMLVKVFIFVFSIVKTNSIANILKHKKFIKIIYIYIYIHMILMSH
jgi:hypothetical protein